MRYFIILMISILFFTSTCNAKLGLPIPRFTALRSNEVNVRVGPGKCYPVIWVFTCQNLPVKVVAEFEQWRKVQGPEGAEGWVHQSMLSGRQMVMIKNAVQALRKGASKNAPATAFLEPGVIGKVIKCTAEACHIKVKKYEGWISITEVWGIL